MEQKKNSLDPYKDLELTTEETETALAQARRIKGSKLAMEAYKRKLREPIEFATLTAEQMFDNIKTIKDFEVDKWNEDIIWQLCYYFSKDKRFTGSFEKGLFIQGPIGCGKSVLTNYFRCNQSNSYILISAREVAYQFSKNGYDAITRYNAPIKNHSRNEFFGQEFLGICFDDVGTETEKKNWGNSENVLMNIILNRYDQKLFRHTHITTNLDGVEIETQYDKRVRSRLKEMCNQIVFSEDAPDRRK
jgi:hypothetical protein